MKLNKAAEQRVIANPEMLIEIVFPVFRCAEDKNVFLSRLYGLPTFNKVEEKEFNFYLTLTGSPLEKEIAELQEICDMWGTKFIVRKSGSE